MAKFSQDKEVLKASQEQALQLLRKIQQEDERCWQALVQKQRKEDERRRKQQDDLRKKLEKIRLARFPRLVSFAGSLLFVRST